MNDRRTLTFALWVSGLGYQGTSKTGYFALLPGAVVLRVIKPL